MTTALAAILLVLWDSTMSMVNHNDLNYAPVVSNMRYDIAFSILFF